MQPLAATEFNPGRCQMSVTDKDFQFLIDWHAGINPFSFHILVFRLYRLLDNGVDDENFNYVGQLQYFPPLSTPKRVLPAGSFFGTGGLTRPDRSYPNPPKVNVGITLKPVT